MFYPENQRIIQRLLDDQVLRPWLGPLTTSLSQWESTIVKKASQKSAREDFVINMLDHYQIIEDKLRHFLSNLVVSSYNFYFPQVQEALNQGASPLSLTHYFLRCSKGQVVSFTLDATTIEMIRLTANAAKDPQANEGAKALLDRVSQNKDMEAKEFAAQDGEFQALWLDRMLTGLEAHLASLVNKLRPWRKGPYQFLSLEVDAEWRSDLKWDRLTSLLPLYKEKILDVGSGNGYHLWRMLEAGAEDAIAIEPFEAFSLQHSLAILFANYSGEEREVAKVQGDDNAKDKAEAEDKTSDKANSKANGKRTEIVKCKAPLMITSPLGEVSSLPAFNKVFCMGVLYHRKDPLLFIEQLASFLVAKGTLVLETMVIPEKDDQDCSCLCPLGKYAGMSNVYFIPTVPLLKQWLKQAGFKTIVEIDRNRTTSLEQRATELSSPISLVDFLDAEDTSKTVEGYPGPLRVILTATKF